MSEGHGRPPLDDGKLQQLRQTFGESTEAVFADLLALFLSETPARLDALRRAAAAEDAATLKWEAHTLKGSCGLLGAGPMAAACSALDALGESGTTAGAAALLDRLEAEFGRVRRALEIHRGGAGA